MFEDDTLLPRFLRLTERQKGAMEQAMREVFNRIESAATAAGQ